MNRFYGHKFWRLSKSLEGMARVVDIFPNETQTVLHEDTKEAVGDYLNRALGHCNDIGLEVSAILVKRIHQEVTEEDCNFGQLVESVKQLHERIEDEMSLALLLHVPKSRAGYYEASNPFGEKVTLRFSDATFDIEEAGNCYATGRNTACVMHFMRALEVSLKAVGIAVGLPNAVELARNSWGTALKAIGDQIGANDKANDPTWMPEKSSFLKDVRAQLFAVKTAWRDNAMHLEKKYDEADAKRIYDAVKNFMGHLAEHLDQAGNFTP